MALTSRGPGAVLGERYRLDDLLEEFEGGRFWRATDMVLARNVAIHVINSTDPRAQALIDAARANVLITDPHLLRVLDCEDDGSAAWVVHEWGEGLSLDKMLDKGPLPPARAAWLARETAQAINAGHAAGLAHGWLTPEQVLVTKAGAVKLIGYATAAALHPDPPSSPTYPELNDHQRDVLNLAGILYAALTAKWPGVHPSGVAPAPKAGRALMRPRQVRAGVPRVLDSICARTLDRSHPHGMPIDSAFEIEAALSDFLGDPAKVAPSSLSAMYAEPEADEGDPIDELLASNPSLSHREEWLEAMAANDDTFGSGPMPAVSPVEPYVDSAERPLFATGARRVPDASSAPHLNPDASVLPPLVRTTPGPTSSTHTQAKQGRTSSRVAIALLIIIVLVIAGVAAIRAYEMGRADAGSIRGIASTFGVIVATAEASIT